MIYQISARLIITAMAFVEGRSNFTSMRFKNHLFLYFSVSLVFNVACNDPSVLGLDLVEGKQLEVELKDDIPFVLETVQGEALQVYNPEDVTLSLRPDVYFSSNFFDPIFGKTQASFYTEFGIEFSKPTFTEGSVPYELKSISLLLPFSPEATYGDTTQEVTIAVYRVTEPMIDGATYLTIQDFEVDPTPIGQTLPFRPTPNVVDSNLVKGLDVVFGRGINIRLSKELGQELLLADSSFYETDTTFSQLLNGIQIKMTSEGNIMLPFTLAGASIDMVYDTVTGLDTDDELMLDFSFPVRTNSINTLNIQHDYTNSIVENYLDKPSSADLAFAQGLTGTNIKLTFPDVSELKGFIVNKAELELPVVQLDGDNAAIYPPAEQLLLFKPTNDKEEFLFTQNVSFRGVRLVDDFDIAAFARAEQAFGGGLTYNQDSTLQFYTLNLSSVFQKIIDGEVSNELIIQVAPPAAGEFIINQELTKLARANRVVVGTPLHEKRKAKFTLIYTKL